MKNPITPLRNIPVRTIVDGVEVVGEIVAVTPNDMSVVIHSPATGLGTGLHVPHFAMAECNRLATCAGHTTTAMTARGKQQAEWLLKELHDYSQGRPSGWGISKLSADGQWTDLPVTPRYP